MDTTVPPTLEDVARAAGVSTATVSRCLNMPHRVRPETRDRIEAAVRELRYTPHFGARALASNRTNTLGLVIPTMENAIFARGLQAMEEELSDNGIVLLVATSHYDSTREHHMVRALLERGVDGLALIGASRPQSTYDLLSARSVPLAILWTYAPDLPYPSFGFDNRAAAAEIAGRVLDCGHRRIAMISGRTAENDRAAARVEGVRAALAGPGIELADGSLAEVAYTLEDGTRAAARLLQATPRPTALICGNDVLAAGALRAARDAGLRVPDDLSVVGFDDIDLAIAVDPALTTVRVPHRRMGRAAAIALRAMARSEEMPVSERFETRVVERASLGPVPG